MHRSRTIPLSALIVAVVATASAPAIALPHRGAMADSLGHAGGCFRVDMTQCCHAGRESYHCHDR